MSMSLISSLAGGAGTSASTAGANAVVDGTKIAADAETAKKSVQSLQQMRLGNSVDLMNSAVKLSEKIRM